MTYEEALVLVLRGLKESAIQFMITGPFASNVHGIPRATQDADIVIEADPTSLRRFLSGLGQGFYVSTDAAMEALQREGMFNVLHLDTGFKVDLIIRKSRPFSRTEFARRERASLLGEDQWFATAEDIILAKLEWARMGQSERQFLDALNVAKVQGAALDRGYLREWSADLGVEALLERLFQELS
jgi:hypothetical protein